MTGLGRTTVNCHKMVNKVLCNEPDYNAKSTACLTKVKRIFVLTLVFTFAAMSIMYGTSSSTKRFTLTDFKTNGGAPEFFRRHLNQFHSIFTGNRSRYYNLSDATRSGFNRTFVNISTTTVSKQRRLEFPDMPDPCAKPRRTTGVEDILCMKRPKFLPDYKNPCWYDGDELRCLPYFHLFGVCKSGTSDMFKRILLHPELVPNKGIFGKEIWYWSWKRFGIGASQQFGKKQLGMTLNEFTDQFYAEEIKNEIDSNGYHKLVTGHGDPMDFWDRFADGKTPQNTPGAEELLWTTPFSVRHINPGVKLILMLRDPIDRLYSHYFHAKLGTSATSFDQHVRLSIPLWKECLAQHSVRSCIYNPQLRKKLKVPIYTSVYSVHLKEWLKAFPRKQIHIFRNEDYATDMGGTLKKLLDFLGVAPPNTKLLDEMVSMPHFYETKGKQTAGPMLKTTRELLIDLYRPYTEDLARMLQDDKFAFKDTSFK